MTPPAPADDVLLDISDLHVSIPQRKGVATPLRGVDLTVAPDACSAWSESPGAARR